jgi:tetratricopeptide (TPR) repeat protein
MMKTTLLALIAAFTVLSCQSLGQKAPSLLEQQEAKLFSDTSGVIDTQEGEKMISLYVAYVDSLPNDSIQCGEYLFKAAEVAMGIEEYWKSIQLFNRLQKQYPGHDLVPDALFYQGFVFENNIGYIEYAKKCYTKYLLDYPRGERAQDVRSIMAVIDQPIEDVVKGWEENSNTEEKE